MKIRSISAGKISLRLSIAGIALNLLLILIQPVGHGKSLDNYAEFHYACKVSNYVIELVAFGLGVFGIRTKAGQGGLIVSIAMLLVFIIL